MKEVYSCMSIDDEPAAHHVLKSHIQKEDRLQLVGQCFNIVEAKEYLLNHEVDLLFLDIHMPEITGLEFLATSSETPKTILTTAYSEYALESYDYGVIDYLLKPISYLRFQKSVERFLSFYEPEKPDGPRFITIKVDGENIKLPQHDIEYIQSFGNYVKVFVHSRYYLASTTTQEILSKLSSKLFVRIHKSFIVNLSKLSGYSEKEVIVSDTVLPIGITYKRELFKQLS